MNFFKVLTILISLFLCGQTLAAKKNNAAKAKWSKLYKMIEKEIKTIRKMKDLGPKLRYRLVELQSEKLKLIREKENIKFIELAAKGKVTGPKRQYFKETLSLYQKTKRDALTIVKKFPRFRYNADIFYTLALNSRDYGMDNRTEHYLKRALSHTGPYDKIVHFIKTALAEHYYNDKKYQQAIGYYEDIVKRTRDEWLSKHYLNMSWCYLKTKEVDKAIGAMRTAFKLSHQKKYIDVKDQVLNAIGFFYVLADRFDEGVNFYLKHVNIPTEYLIKMAKKTADKGKIKKAQFILGEALQNAKKHKKPNNQLDVHLAKLEIYRNMKYYEYHFTTSQDILTLSQNSKLDKEKLFEATEKMKDMVGFLQVQISKDVNKFEATYSEERLNRIISYFDILSSIDRPRENLYRFYQGETYYSLKRFKDALPKYKTSMEITKRVLKLKKKPIIEVKGKELKQLALARQTMDALLASLEAIQQLGPKERYYYTTYSYSTHLNLWPKDPRSQVIYRKLFNIYVKKTKVKNSLKVLNKYIANYPKDQKIQRGMLIGVIDNYIKSKNITKLAAWIAKLDSGFLNFDKDYIEKATLVLVSLLFNEYQKLDSQGKKKEAIAGYAKLYKHPKYPAKVKAQSAYNIGTLYLEQKLTKLSYQWMARSLHHFEEKEILKLMPKYWTISQRMVQLQNFKVSSLLTTTLYTKFCQKDFKLKTEFFQHSIHINLVENNFKEANRLLQTANQCKIKKETQTTLAKQMMAHFMVNKKYPDYFDFFIQNKENPKLRDKLNTDLVAIYWDTVMEQKEGLKKTVTNIFSKLRSKNKGIPMMSSILDFENFSKHDVTQFAPSLTSGPKFDEKRFNTELERILSNTQTFTSRAEILIKSGEPNIVVGTYHHLITAYNKVISAIDGLTPKGMPKEYVVAFKTQMNGLTQNFKGQVNKYHQTAFSILDKNEILSIYNNHFLKTRQNVNSSYYRYPAKKLVITMDQRGERR